jgi:hypothetical protein
MPALLYYLPQRPGLDAAALAAAGLGHLVDRDSPAGISQRGCHCGPDKGEGVVLALGRHEAEVGYYPDRQRWQRLAGTPAAWIGLPPADAPQPGPAELARSTQLAGHEVELLDGRRWLAPAARAYVEQDGHLRWLAQLPQRLELDPEGRWRAGDVIGRHAFLWDLAEKWEETKRAAAVGDGKTLVEWQELVDGAVAVLGANYHLGRGEVAALGLLSEAAAIAVLDALVDWPTRLAWGKKKLGEDADRGGGPISAGGPG